MLRFVLICLVVCFISNGLLSGQDAITADALETKTIEIGEPYRQYLEALLKMRLQHKDLPESDLAAAETVLRAVQNSKIKKQDKAKSQIIDSGAGREKLEEMLKNSLREAVADDPENREARLKLAKFYFYTGEPQLASRHLQMIGPANEQDIFWPLLSANADLLLGEYDKGVKELEQTFEAASRLVPLRIDRAVFCDQIRQHGQYTPRQKDFLKPGEATWIYLEVVGGVFNQQPSGNLGLSFRFDIELRDEMQNTILNLRDFGVINPEYQHQVREVYAGMDFVLPRDARDGNYTLIITCRDENSGKKASRDILFKVQN